MLRSVRSVVSGGESDGLTVVVFAFECGFDEGDDFESLVGRDGRGSVSRESVDDVLAEIAVGVPCRDVLLDHGVFTPGSESVRSASGPAASNQPLSSVVPGAQYHFGVVTAVCCDALAARPHQLEQHLHRVDPVVEQPGIAFGSPGRPEADCSVDPAIPAVAVFAEFDHFLAESHPRPRKERHVGVASEPKHFAGVFGPAGDRFIDEDRQAGCEKRSRAFQVRRSREREDEDGVDPADHLHRVIDQFDFQGFDLGTKPLDPFGSHFGCSRPSQDHSSPFDSLIIGHTNAVDTPSELDAMRTVEVDDTETEHCVGRVWGEGERW